MNAVYAILNWLVIQFSFEFLLTKFKWTNGGTVIFIRTILISLIVLFAYISIKQSLDSNRIFEFSLIELKAEVVNSLQLYGAIFGAIYIALYSRYSSQWNYLANLYNLIKQTEASGISNNVSMAEWKAGFIEDALTLHLARKPMFKFAIHAWTKDRKVQKAFLKSVHNGKKQLRKLMEELGTP